VASLPFETGIFYMHNKDGEIIYLSRSSNIRKRVNQQFIKPGPRARKLQKETRKVTYEKTGSELIAKLKEYEEVKRNLPYYNQLKGKLFSHGLFPEHDKEGYLKFKINPIRQHDHGIITFNGHESGASFLQKITTELESINSKVTLEESNITAEAVISKYSLKNKNMLIVDKGRDIGEQSVILIKEGTFKGLGYCELNHQINNIHILESIITPAEGDANTDHIIASHLRKKGSHKIVELNP
jgi:DNA polymerase-3 subunit epsilon